MLSITRESGWGTTDLLGRIIVIWIHGLGVENWRNLWVTSLGESSALSQYNYIWETDVPPRYAISDPRPVFNRPWDAYSSLRRIKPVAINIWMQFRTFNTDMDTWNIKVIEIFWNGWGMLFRIKCFRTNKIRRIETEKIWNRMAQIYQWIKLLLKLIIYVTMLSKNG